MERIFLSDADVMRLISLLLSDAWLTFFVRAVADPRDAQAMAAAGECEFFYRGASMRARYLTETEIKELRAVAPALWLPFIVGAKTGLRIGDVLKIRPTDIYCGGVRYVAQKTGKGGRAALDTDTLFQ